MNICVGFGGVLASSMYRMCVVTMHMVHVCIMLVPVHVCARLGVLPVPNVCEHGGGVCKVLCVCVVYVYCVCVVSVNCL